MVWNRSCLGGLLLLGLVGCTGVEPAADSPSPEAADSPPPKAITPPNPEQQDTLSLSLQNAIAVFLADNGNPSADDPLKVHTTDLNQDGRSDALVLLGSPNWCGTGGCTLLVFEGMENQDPLPGEPDDTYTLVSRISLVQEPLIISDTATNGWQDLILEVSGGGATPGQVVLTFDGSTYPTNPSVLSPLPDNTEVSGKAVFSPDLPFRALGDKPVWEAACRDAIAAQYSTEPAAITLEFARADEGGAAYGFLLPDGVNGTCRAAGEGTVEYIEAAPN
jgi:hypothetical protein